MTAVVSKIFTPDTSCKRYASLDWKNVFHQSNSLLDAVKDDVKAGKTKEAAEVAIDWLLTFDRKFSEDVFFEYDEEGWMIALVCEDWADVIESAFLSPSTNDSTKQAILADIEKLNSCSIYEDYGFLDMKRFVQRMKSHGVTGDEALQQLDELIKHERRVGEYLSKLYELVFRKANILREQGKDTEAERAILEDIGNEKVCEQYVSELVEKKAYGKALDALAIAISRSEDARESLRTDHFVKQKLNIYKAMGDEPKMTQTLRELFKLSYGKLEYYKELKTQIAADEWKDFLARLMSETQFTECVFDGVNEKAEIYLEEGNIQALADYLKHADDEIIDLCRAYITHLPDNLIAEVLPSYVAALRVEASRANKASRYERLANHIQDLSQWKGGKALATSLVTEFMTTYSNRPAMRRALSGAIRN